VPRSAWDSRPLGASDPTAISFASEEASVDLDVFLSDYLSGETP
jgi:hypothetical protein